MSKLKENSPLGFVDCLFCGAKVEIRRSLRTGKAYWTCDGDHDVRACHSQVRLGPRPTRELIEHRERTAGAPTPGKAEPPAAAPAPAVGPNPCRPAPVPARREPDPASRAPIAVAPPRAAPTPGTTASPKEQPARPASSFGDIWGNLLGR